MSILSKFCQHTAQSFRHIFLFFPLSLCLSLCILLSACGDSAQQEDKGAKQKTDASETRLDSARQDSLQVDSGYTLAAQPPDSPVLDLMVPPDTLRALYVNRWAAMGRKVWKLVEVAKTTEINALVIDVKDDRGLTLYQSDIMIAKEIGAGADGHAMSRARLKMLMDSLRANNIFAIARIVVAKDPLMAIKKPEWSIRKKVDSSQPWHDKKGRPWLDPHHLEVWQYATDLGMEALSLGFSEVQFDYMRFPDEDGLKKQATFPLAAGRRREEVIRQQLDTCQKQFHAVGARLTGDVFGLTSTAIDDMGIGQKWESFVDKLDVVLPMSYPSHYARQSYGLANPNANPYETIKHSIGDCIRRSAGVPGAAKLMPWYQDFTLGKPRYGKAEVRAQIQAGYDLKVYDWVLWNPSSNYTIEALEAR